MSEPRLRVTMLELRDGTCPLLDWLGSLTDKTTRARVALAIERMSVGNLGDHKEVGGGVFERRLDFGPGYRVYFGRGGRVLVVLLGGGVKRGQQADIAAARDRWRAYLEQRPDDRVGSRRGP
ncbi:MAG: type II toxin-antitoxin system RelE/ParE family toxin [Armatimonadetes bacterium]|nr:type II toxin-antitoxin system RelE/ParE family toxin [Armatimonadota bacterium]